MARRPTAQELESIAMAIARQQLTQHKQLAVVKRQLHSALNEVATAKAELQEAQSRLEEIDVYLEDVEEEVQEMTARGEELVVIQRKQEESDELLEEREDELSLILQLQRVLDLRVSVQSHLRRMYVHLTRELARNKQREQLLAVIAMRSGMLKLMPRKL